MNSKSLLISENISEQSFQESFQVATVGIIDQVLHTK